MQTKIEFLKWKKINCNLAWMSITLSVLAYRVSACCNLTNNNDFVDFFTLKERRPKQLQKSLCTYIIYKQIEKKEERNREKERATAHTYYLHHVRLNTLLNASMVCKDGDLGCIWMRTMSGRIAINPKITFLQTHHFCKIPITGLNIFNDFVCKVLPICQ